MALRHSATGRLYENEICEFVYEHFPYFRSAQEDRWRKSIRETLVKNSYFQTTEEEGNNSYNMVSRLRKNAVWRIKPQQVGQMDRKIKVWTRTDPEYAKRTLLYPK